VAQNKKSGESGKSATSNIIPNCERTPTERKEIAKKGGQASGEARRKRKTFREVFKALLPMQVNSDKVTDLTSLIQDTNPEMTAEQAIAMAQIYKAINGDTQAAIFVRDTVGDKPKEQIEQTINGFDKYFKADENE